MARWSKSRQNGFTLLEMMLVVALAGIISTMAIARYSPNRHHTAPMATELLTVLQQGLEQAMQHQRWYGLALTQQGWQLKAMSQTGTSAAERWQDVAPPFLLPKGARLTLRMGSTELKMPAVLQGVSEPLIWFNPQGETAIFSLRLEAEGCTDILSSTGFLRFWLEEQSCDKK